MIIINGHVMVIKGFPSIRDAGCVHLEFAPDAGCVHLEFAPYLARMPKSQLRASVKMAFLVARFVWSNDV